MSYHATGTQIRIQLRCVYRSTMRITRQLLIGDQQMLFQVEFERDCINETSLYSLRFIQQCNVYGVISLTPKRVVLFLSSNRKLIVRERSKLRYPGTDNQFSLVTILYRTQI